MHDILMSIILGVVEGLSEFLPISSTGHLLVAENLLGLGDSWEAFTVVIQLGAVLAVVVIYFQTFWKALVGLPSSADARRFEGDKLPLLKAFQIGCCQIISIIPGVSRSGATILGGELLGVDRRAATMFTFYLAVPTMLGATILELHHKADALSHGQALNIAVGFVVSFIVAFFVIREFLTIVTKYGLKPFGWYRIAAGLALVAYLVIH
jgi:undecaprenyl-diphosphatase